MDFEENLSPRQQFLFGQQADLLIKNDRITVGHKKSQFRFKILYMLIQLRFLLFRDIRRIADNYIDVLDLVPRRIIQDITTKKINGYPMIETVFSGDIQRGNADIAGQELKIVSFFSEADRNATAAGAYIQHFIF